MADRILGGRYAIQDKIGTGGMAIVYRGHDTVLGRVVAVKTMLPQYAADQSFAARFKQEAQAAAALQSPYIVSVYDWGKDDDTYYIVMEYLRGTDLKSGIRKHGALAPRKVAQIGSQIAQALNIAHRHDIIHRDIKPQNIMVQPDGNIKVMDFGIARAKNSHLTADNSVLGTAHYVSPEQTQGKELGPTSDIYSLGVVMYEAATGKVPFEGDDAISVALKQVNEQPVAPSEVNPNVDSALEAIIMKCMQKNPENRFQSADELYRALRDYLSGHVDNVIAATSVMNKPAQTQAIGRIDATQAIGRIDKTQAMPQLGNIAQNNGNRSYGKSASNKQDDNKGSKKGTIIAIIVTALVLGLIGFGIWRAVGASDVKTTPNLNGLMKEEAITQIKDSNFFEVGEITEEFSPHIEPGRVISQNPRAGSKATKGTRINLTISKGEKPIEEVEVPDLKGMTPDAARQELVRLGLVAGTADGINTNDVEKGLIADQSPKAGTKLEKGSTVNLQISLGPDLIDVPDVTGLTRGTAFKKLQDVGFSIDLNEANSDTVPSGSVISYSPTGKQSKGTTIVLTISTGPASTSAPSTTIPGATTPPAGSTTSSSSTS